VRRFWDWFGERIDSYLQFPVPLRWVIAVVAFVSMFIALSGTSPRLQWPVSVVVGGILFVLAFGKPPDAQD